MKMIAQEFNFLGYDLDEESGRVLFNYQLIWDSSTDRREKKLTFTEVFFFGEGHDWDLVSHGLLALLYFIAGVSYYKAGIPPKLNFQNIRPSAMQATLINAVYSEGLAEMAYRNNLNLPVMSFYDESGNPILLDEAVLTNKNQVALQSNPAESFSQQAESLLSEGGIKVLLPFGGGIDSLTSLELLRYKADEMSLFIMSRTGDRYAAIENAAEVAKLPIVRAERQLDEKILKSDSLGLLNGHVPVTAVVSAAAVLSAYLNGFNHVVMSNEKSASFGSLLGNKTVNHQWSKGIEFETMMHAVIREITSGSLRYFSLLRAVSELWVAKRFSQYESYLPVFRSCNRAFHLDPAQRMDKWCGVCDKCCFIDLILAPFLSKATLEKVFSGSEPLSLPANREKFLALLGLTVKPFECVGDVTECRAALYLAAKREDRADDSGLALLVAELVSLNVTLTPGEQEIEKLLYPEGIDFVPGYLRDVLF